MVFNILSGILTLLAVITVFILIGCSRDETVIDPDRFSVRMDFDTGPLPEEFFYSYSIAIGPGNEGCFTFKSMDESYKRRFELDRDSIKKIILWLSENNILEDDWKYGEPIDGAPNISLSIDTGKHSWNTGQIPELLPEYNIRAKNAFNYILGFVPEEIRPGAI